MGNQEKTVLGFFAAQNYEVQSLLLARSLRHFGGVLAELPIWIYYPEDKPLQGPALEVLEDLDIHLIPFPIDEDIQRFPFAGKTLAAAVAEEHAEKEGVILAWHDRTGFIHQAPFDFILPADIAFAFRPTDIANIGAPLDGPLPEFWQKYLAHFSLEVKDLPPITTAIDQKELRLYVNAGLLVVRPEKRLLRTWADCLKQTYALPEFKPFYQQNQAYAIFMHQAALTAATVMTTTPEEREILPNTYLFSVDNFFDYPPKERPLTLDQITTGRFHDFFALPNWQEKVIASPGLVDWFQSVLTYGPYWPEG
jgi:hypothetical protein